MKLIHKPLRDVFTESATQLGYLRDRWKDECMFEDFEDYRKSAEETITKAGGTFVKMTKAFTTTFTADGHTGTIKVNAREIKLYVK
tara:strand:+ start:1113 stop:1370 length:258 start_codon:yes stop_codon:yes gene_type:complete